MNNTTIDTIIGAPPGAWTIQATGTRITGAPGRVLFTPRGTDGEFIIIQPNGSPLLTTTTLRHIADAIDNQTGVKP